MSELTKEEKKQLKKLGTELIKADELSKQSAKQSQLLRQEIIEVMNQAGIKSFVVKDDSTADAKDKTITMAERMDIKYDLEKMKEKLGKELYNEVAVKIVTIAGLDKFKQIMKEYEVPFSEVKGILNIHEEISNARINELYKRGDIDLKKIKGCFTAKFTNYISIR